MGKYAHCHVACPAAGYFPQHLLPALKKAAICFHSGNQCVFSAFLETAFQHNFAPRGTSMSGTQRVTAPAAL